MFLLGLFNWADARIEEAALMDAGQDEGAGELIVQDVFYLDGKSEPGARIELQFTKLGSEGYLRYAKANERGNWIFAEKLDLEDGAWEVKTRFTRMDGSVSAWSEPVVFNSMTVARAKNAANSGFYILVAIFLSVLLAVLALIFFWRGKLRLRIAKFEKEIAEAEFKAQYNFSRLEKDILASFDALGTAAGLDRNYIDPEKEKLQREISALETDTEKEIKDIERLKI